jgi:cob(I)alamin adenosyltransferase
VTVPEIRRLLAACDLGSNGDVYYMPAATLDALLARIDALEAEVERLRDPLQRIADSPTAHRHMARAALDREEADDGA